MIDTKQPHILQKKSKSLPKFSSSSVRIFSHFFLLFKLHLHHVLLPNLVIINSSYDLLSHVHYYMYMIVIDHVTKSLWTLT